MRDVKSVLTDLKNLYFMPLRYEAHMDGSGEYHMTTGMAEQMKKTVKDAMDVINNLALERDSLMDLLEDQDGHR